MDATAFDLARQVAAESPPPGTYPRVGVMSPTYKKRWVNAGWPHRAVVVTVTHPASVDAGGWHRPERTQQVEMTVFPASWARRFAELQGVALKDVVSGRYSEESP